jgi:hypothetical protein
MNLIYGIHARGGSGRGCFFFNITSNLYIWVSTHHNFG